MSALPTAAPPQPRQDAGLLPLRVRCMRWHAPKVLEIELAAPGGRPLPSFEPGAHIDLHLPNGLARSYSLIGEGGAPQAYRLAVSLDPASRGASRYVHEALRPGALVQASHPRNLFALVESAPGVVLIAGGIGVTPLIGMAARCARRGIPWAMHYCVPEGPAPFADELAALPGGRLTCHHTRAPQGGRADLESLVAQAPAGTHFYCCGPASMLDAFARATAGLEPGLAHMERFRAAPANEAADDDMPLAVELAASGCTLQVPPGRTILQAMLDAGLNASYACEQGICGLCEARVLRADGELAHRDHVKTPEEHARDGTLMICCSRARGGTLVLDL